jgi:hypothetical protein
LKFFNQIICLNFLIQILFSCAVSDNEFSGTNTTEKVGCSIPISWFDELKSDYTFSKQWKYANDIELNDYQQIICWKCPTRAQKMLDKRKKIISDSMNVFYQLIDSTRHYYSLESRSSIINLNENHFIEVKKYGDFIIEGFTKSDDSSQCSLFFRMKDNYITSWIYQKKESGIKIFELKEGKFFADKSAFEMGILKANFSFVYQSENSFKAIYWSGKINAKILGI